jgi:hypothetical protein
MAAPGEGETMDLPMIVVACPECSRESVVTLSFSHGDEPACGHCKHVLLKYEPIQGFIYAVTNVDMPGLVKIGLSRRSVEERVSELSSATGVPSGFRIEAYYPSTNPEVHEREIHESLGPFRVEGKEFFRCDLPLAISAIEKVIGRDALFASDECHVARTPAGLSFEDLPVNGGTTWGLYGVAQVYKPRQDGSAETYLPFL